MLLFPSLTPPLATLETGAGIYFTMGKKPFSDHPHALKAPPEPYGKGSSAPAINTDGKAARPPCSPCDKQHMDVGTFQQSLRESQDPRHRQLPARPQERALLPRAGLTPLLSDEDRQHPWHSTLAQPHWHSPPGTAPPAQHPLLLFRWPWSLGCPSRAPLPSWPCSTQQTPNSHDCSSLNHALRGSFI